jgi:TetR/AcrR family transcriptional regulator, fatty acid biosynthesis regulator
MVTDGDDGRRRRRLSPEERRDHLLDVAAALVVEHGVDAVTMERVAQQAGVSRGLGYAYFTNSDDLLAALFERELAGFDGRVAAATAGAETVEEHLRAALTTYFDMLAEKGVLLTRLTEMQSQAPVVQERRSSRERAIERFYGEMLTREMGLPPKRARAVASLLNKALPQAAELWARGVLRRREAIELFVVMARGAASAVAEHPFEAVSSARE